MQNMRNLHHSKFLHYGMYLDPLFFLCCSALCCSPENMNMPSPAPLPCCFHLGREGRKLPYSLDFMPIRFSHKYGKGGGGAYNWIMVISLIYTPPFLAVERSRETAREESYIIIYLSHLHIWQSQREIGPAVSALTGIYRPWGTNSISSPHPSYWISNYQYQTVVACVRHQQSILN